MEDNSPSTELRAQVKSEPLERRRGSSFGEEEPSDSADPHPIRAYLDTLNSQREAILGEIAEAKKARAGHRESSDQGALRLMRDIFHGKRETESVLLCERAKASVARLPAYMQNDWYDRLKWLQSVHQELLRIAGVRLQGSIPDIEDSFADGQAEGVRVALLAWRQMELESDAASQAERDAQGAQAPAAATAQTPTADSTATLAAVSKNGKAILDSLLKHYPALQTIEEICDETNLSDRTIGPELKTLIDANIAARPNGERKGATLTPAGKALAERLSAK